MNIKTIIAKVNENMDLTADDMTFAMETILNGDATDAQIAGLAIAMNMKGITVTELTAAVRTMRRLSIPQPLNCPNAVDIVGTGGDLAELFNISTAAAFVIAGAGGHVAKHGNRSYSSISGSADVLEAAGVKLDITPATAQYCIEKIGISFLFAQQYHPALKHAASARKQLGVRTFFNLLGPLCNPANVTHQVIGVSHSKWLMLFAEVLKELGSQHALVVHSQDSLDEISIAAATDVVELKHGKISQYTITPEQFNLPRAALTTLRIETPQQSLALIQQVLANQPGPAKDIVIFNAGAALYTAGIAATIAEGIAKATAALANGSAKQKLQDLIQATHQICYN